MNRTCCLLLIGLLSVLALLPRTVMAQEPVTETITVQVNVTLPTGNAVIGTIVAQRTYGAEVVITGTFNGMLDGKPFSVSGSAIEHWVSDTQVAVEVTSINVPGMAQANSLLRTYQVVQSSPGLVLVEGMPIAVDAPLVPPRRGTASVQSANYTVTNAGAGPQILTQLPNTAGGIGGHPFVMAGLLVAVGSGLLLVSRLLREPQHPGGD